MTVQSDYHVSMTCDKCGLKQYPPLTMNLHLGGKQLCRKCSWEELDS